MTCFHQISFLLMKEKNIYAYIVPSSDYDKWEEVNESEKSKYIWNI